MAQIFVRQRRHAGPGSGHPQFAVVAVAGTDLRFERPFLRKSELEVIAQTIGAEIIHLPAGGEHGGGGEGHEEDTACGCEHRGPRHRRQEA